jgi:hypothetical protein
VPVRWSVLTPNTLVRSAGAAHLADYRKRTGRRQNVSPKPLPSLANWGADLVTLRGLRRDAFVKKHLIDHPEGLGRS